MITVIGVAAVTGASCFFLGVGYVLWRQERERAELEVPVFIRRIPDRSLHVVPSSGVPVFAEETRALKVPTNIPPGAVHPSIVGDLNEARMRRIDSEVVD